MSTLVPQVVSSTTVLDLLIRLGIASGQGSKRGEYGV